MNQIKDIDVAVLCGGLGKRLRSVVGESQKVMSEVNGRPFLDLIIEELKAQGFSRIILCTGYKSEIIEEYYKSKNYGIKIDFSKEEKPLGTGGAIKNAKDIIKSESFFVLNGDSLCKINYCDFLDFHSANNAVVSIVLSKGKDTNDYGVVKLNDEDASIISFEEKEKAESGNYLNNGIYCFNQSIFNLFPEAEEFSLENDFFPTLVGKNFYGFVVNNDFIDIGTPQRLKKARTKI